MKIATFLPHVGVFGGVRRFIELGNAWTAAGHQVTLYHPTGEAPAWLDYRGRVAPLDRAAAEASDLAIGADAATYAAFREHRASRHLFYGVLEKDAGVARATADRGVLLAANSGPLRRTMRRQAGRAVLDGIGGINRRQFYPDPAARRDAPLTVIVNGRRSRSKKGTDLILAGLAGLIGRVPEFEIVLFDTPGPRDSDPRDLPLPPNARYVIGPTQTELAALYRSAHLHIAAERKAGWCNTAMEAMASGCAVACTRSGTTDFARHDANALVVPVRHAWFVRAAAGRLLRDAELRARLSARAVETADAWTWEKLAAKLLDQITAGAA